MAQPTEQCVQTVRLTSTLPASGGVSPLASAVPIRLKGSCEAKAPAPAAMPERFMKVRRSSASGRMPSSMREALLAAAGCDWDDFLVNMAVPPRSDARGAVVTTNVFGFLVALGVGHRLDRRFGLRLHAGHAACQSSRSTDATETRADQEIAALVVGLGGIAARLLVGLAHFTPPSAACSRK